MRNGKCATQPALAAAILGILVTGTMGAARAGEMRALKVTFFDFNSSHSDFGSYGGGNRFQTNMMAPDLPLVAYSGGNKKMPRKGTQEFYSGYIEDWFNPDKAVGSVCRTLFLENVGTPESPRWRYDQCTQGCVGSGCGVSNNHCTTFFPIDDIPSAQMENKGAHDGKSHNYNWTMELNASFKYRGGETFFFRGDDDLWVFINNKVALDFGGIHDPLQEKSINLDELATGLGIAVGGTYDIDVYFAERKGASSTFYIESSIDLKPLELAAIAIVDSTGRPVTGSYEIKGRTLFSVQPTFSFEGGGSCTNYGTPPSAASDISAAWTLAGKPVATDTSVFVVTPEMVTLGQDIVLQAAATDPKTLLTRTASATLKPAVVVVPDSVVLTGNGRMQAVRIDFNFSPTRLPTGWKAEYTYGGKTVTVDAGRGSAAGATSWTYTLPPTGWGAAGASDVPIALRATFTSADTTVSVRVIDRMTPAVSPLPQPNFTPASGTVQTHTLTFTVSEELAHGGSLKLSDLVFIRGNGTYTIPSGEAQISLRNQTEYTITFILAATVLPGPGDSLSLAAGTADKAGNAAARNPVAIAGRSIEAASIVSVLYLDADADGQIDSAVLTFSRDLILPPTQVNLSNAGRTHQASSSRGDRIAFAGATPGKVVTVRLGSANAMAPGVTGLRSPALSVGAQPFQGIDSLLTTTTVQDKAAPVIVSAAYRPGPGESSDGNRHDTLTVVFSEAVQLARAGQSPDTPFVVLHDSTMLSYTVSYVSGGGSERLVFDVLDVGGMGYPTQGDSIWIEPGRKVADMVSNAQTNARNRRVALDITFPPVELEFLVSRNPFVPGTDTIPAGLRTRVPGLTGSTGTILVVRTSAVPIPKEEFGLSGKVVIYDAVGNVVSPFKPMLPGTDGNLYFPWDGRNAQDRLVGTGTYLASIETDDAVNGRTRRTARIGVKR